MAHKGTQFLMGILKSTKEHQDRAPKLERIEGMKPFGTIMTCAGTGTRRYQRHI